MAVNDVPQLQDAAALGFFETTKPVLTRESSQSTVDPFMYPRETVSRTILAPEGSMNSLAMRRGIGTLRVVIVQLVVVHREFILKTGATARLHGNTQMHLVQGELLFVRDLENMLVLRAQKWSHLCTFFGH